MIYGDEINLIKLININDGEDDDNNNNNKNTFRIWRQVVYFMHGCYNMLAVEICQ
jgi:hypothetical protein